MSLTEQIFEAGIVGCGGAGFPTHVKLNASPQYFIINGAECEPLLRTDRYLMTHFPEKIVSGAEQICKERNIPNAYIALKESYREEIAAMQQAIDAAHSNLKIHLLTGFYPAGDEQVIVYEVTGKVVPPSGIPLDVGAVVDNVATVVAIDDAMHQISFTDKYLTVTGEVAAPTVLKVPVGTPFSKCIELAGGALWENYVVVSGGPMMGKAMSKEEAEQAVVTKTTSGILVLKDDSKIASRYQTDVRHMLNRARSACIQCSFCTQLCPRHLLGHPIEPHRIMRKMAGSRDMSALLDDVVIRQAAICCECGVCEVVACPMGLQPRTINSMLKGELAKAGIRYEKPEQIEEVNPMREARKAPTMKTAARAGVLKYYHYDIKNCVEHQPTEVCIPLKMNIGASSVPCVPNGKHVQKGELIAAAPEGKLGANIHASISGIVDIESETIRIRG